MRRTKGITMALEDLVEAALVLEDGAATLENKVFAVCLILVRELLSAGNNPAAVYRLCAALWGMFSMRMFTLRTRGNLASLLLRYAGSLGVQLGERMVGYCVSGIVWMLTIWKHLFVELMRPGTKRFKTQL